MESTAKKFQLTIRHLFYATALIAAGLAFNPSTFVFSIFILIGWNSVFKASNPRRALITALLLLLLSGCLVGMLQPITVVRGPHSRAHCMNNMKQVILAMHHYESEHGHFPTDRIVTTDDGKELRHSWRIETLRFFEGDAIYDAYDFNEAWNGPNNSKLLDPMPSAFRCPSHHSGTKTPYQLVGGTGTAFELEKQTRFGDVPDGASNVIGLIENTANPVNWMEPTDLTVDGAVKLLTSLDEDSYAHFSDSTFQKTYFGSHIVLLDGSVYCWPPYPHTPITAGAFLIDDGTRLDIKSQGNAWIKRKYDKIISLGVYILLIILPAFQAFRFKMATRIDQA